MVADFSLFCLFCSDSNENSGQTNENNCEETRVTETKSINLTDDDKIVNST